MRRRARLVACLAGALSIASASGVALAAAAGTYQGTTSQHGPVTITVKGNKITSVYIGVVSDCSLTIGGTEQWTYTFHKSVKVKNGKIEYHTISHSYAIDLSARLKGKTIKGTLDAVNPDGCITPTINFSAGR